MLLVLKGKKVGKKKKKKKVIIMEWDTPQVGIVLPSLFFSPLKTNL